MNGSTQREQRYERFLRRHFAEIFNALAQNGTDDETGALQELSGFLEEWQAEKSPEEEKWFELDGKRYHQFGPLPLTGALVRSKLAFDRYSYGIYFDGTPLGDRISDSQVIPSGSKLVAIPPCHT